MERIAGAGWSLTRPITRGTILREHDLLRALAVGPDMALLRLERRPERRCENLNVGELAPGDLGDVRSVMFDGNGREHLVPLVSSGSTQTSQNVI